MQNSSSTTLKDPTLTVLYDNNPSRQGLQTDWGFSCLITGAEKTILFDTGAGNLLIDNIEQLQIDPSRIDVVVLSHIHTDHSGGLDYVLQKNTDLAVYVPKSFPDKIKSSIRGYATELVEVKEPVKICENIYSTGQLGIRIKEQSLVIQTEQGIAIITGCAHPGIIHIVSTAKDLLKGDILLVMGGFHLEWAFAGGIEKIIAAFEKMNVHCVGPCHCTGHRARELFARRFGSRYIDVGVGKTIKLDALQ